MNRFLALLLAMLLLTGIGCSQLEEDLPPTATFPVFDTPTPAASTLTANELPTIVLQPAATPTATEITATPTEVTVTPMARAETFTATATEAPATATPTAALPTGTATTGAPTATQPSPTHTPPPTTTPNATTAPTTVAVPADPPPERIVVAAGATGATVSDQLGAVEIDRYVLWARADQIMSVQVSTGGPATMLLSIYGTDGTLLKRDAVGGPVWSGTVPTSQDYIVAVRTAGEVAASYTVAVEISPLTAAPAPERITFDQGAISATLSGTLAREGGVKQYVLRALAGQRVEVRVTSDYPGIVLSSLRREGGETLGVTSDPNPVVTLLPETGDYLITLTTHNIAPAVEYTLFVEVTDAGTLPEPERIVFAPNTTGTTVRGTLPSGGIERYILRALEGQTMTLAVGADPAGALSIVVETADGQYLTAGTDTTPLALTLPTTQDYLITLSSPMAAPAIAYEMAIEIQ